jgi:hypothetical protein
MKTSLMQTKRHRISCRNVHDYLISSFLFLLTLKKLCFNWVVVVADEEREQLGEESDKVAMVAGCVMDLWVRCLSKILTDI